MLANVMASISPHTRGYSDRDPAESGWILIFPAYTGMFLVNRAEQTKKGYFPHTRGDVPALVFCRRARCRFSRIRGDIPEARPAMRKILLKKFSQQGSLFSFQTFRSGDHIKLAPTFTKPKVDFLCPNYKIPALYQGIMQSIY